MSSEPAPAGHLMRAPISVEMVSAALRSAGDPALVVGRRTALHIGAPPTRPVVELATHRLDQIHDYSPGDMYLTAGAGTALSTVQQVAGAEGQRLSLDPPEDGSI